MNSFNLIKTLLVWGLFIFTATTQAAPRCEALFGLNQSVIVGAQSTSTSLLPASINPKGDYSYQGYSFSGSIKDLEKTAAFKNIVQKASVSTARSFGQLQMPISQGSGSLDLVRLTLKSSNLAYNHHDLVALLKSNEKMANKAGFYKVSDYDNVVWAPSIEQLNYRMNKTAQENGLEKAVWTFQKVDGVVDLEPYLYMLSKGQFPFVGASDYNLAVHDAMHGVAFAALNSTPSSSQVMKLTLKRVQLAHKLYTEIVSDFPGLQNQLSKHIGLIVSDPLEKTMLLSIILSGNYQYYSAANSLNQGRSFTLQNREITIQRVKNILKMLTYGHVNFKWVYDQLKKSNLTPAQIKKLKKIFNTKIESAPQASDTLLSKAATEIVDRFMSSNLFSSSEQVRQLQLSKGIEIDAADPSVPMDNQISTGEQSIN